jgi:hypothetical protein
MEDVLPDLRIVATDALTPHEQADRQRSEPLARRLQAEGLLRNPPVVTALGTPDGRFVILDGANRYTAATVLELPHLLVQVVDYDDPALRLSTWYHVVAGCDRATLDFTLDGLDGLVREPGDLLHARAALARRDVLASVVFADGQVELLRAGGDLRARTAVLNAIVDGYKGCAKIYRTTTDRVAEVRELYRELTAIVVFPHYDPAEILDLARDGIPLPAGITRHIIPRRALRLNYPLERLAGAHSLAEKNAELQEWLRERLAAKGVRYYAEPTVLFDE